MRTAPALQPPVGPPACASASTLRARDPGTPLPARAPRHLRVLCRGSVSFNDGRNGSACSDRRVRNVCRTDPDLHCCKADTDHPTSSAFSKVQKNKEGIKQKKTSVASNSVKFRKKHNVFLRLSLFRVWRFEQHLDTAGSSVLLGTFSAEVSGYERALAQVSGRPWTWLSERATDWTVAN